MPAGEVCKFFDGFSGAGFGWWCSVCLLSSTLALEELQVVELLHKHLEVVLSTELQVVELLHKHLEVVLSTELRVVELLHTHLEVSIRHILKILNKQWIVWLLKSLLLCLAVVRRSSTSH